MTKILKTTDNARATLASGISAAATTIALTTGQGTQMPQAKFGTASSAGTSTVLNDTGDLAFLAIGDIIANHTDGSWAVVTATGTNSVTTTPLIGGTDNTWQNSDEWRYNEFVATLTNETVNPNGTITTNKREKVLVKNVATDTLTVVRGYDSSTAQTFSANDYCNIFSVSVMNDGIREALSDIRREVNTFYTSIDNLANSQLTHATSTNTGNAYILTCNAIIDAYVTGMRISFNPSANNTGTTTVNLNGLGVKTIKKFSTIDLGADDLKSGIPTVLVYDGTNFQMQSFASSPNAGINNNPINMITGVVDQTLVQRTTTGVTNTDVSDSTYQYTIPANSMVVGDVFLLHVSGFTKTSLVGSFSGVCAADIQLKFGSIVMLNVGLGGGGSVPHNVALYQSSNGYAMVTATGASGKIIIFPNSAILFGLTGASCTNANSATEITIDTTVAQNIRVAQYVENSGSGTRDNAVQVLGAGVIKIPKI